MGCKLNVPNIVLIFFLYHSAVAPIARKAIFTFVLVQMGVVMLAGKFLSADGTLNNIRKAVAWLF